LNLIQDRGFVLKTSPYAEADKLAWFYTPHFGKIRAIAKGVRKPQSRLSSVLELFTESSCTFHKKGGGDLYVLGQTKILNSHSRLKGDFLTITLLQVMADILIQALQDGESHEELYRLIRGILKVLEDQKDAREQALITFALHFLEISGYPLELEICVECQSSLERKKAFLIPYRGGSLCENCCPSGPSRLRVSPAGLQVLRKLKSLPLEKVHILKMRRELLKEVFLGIMVYIAQTVERPLKTVEYYLKVLPV
jgi:DNA repair protein RecO (recombination protein O)